MPNQYPLKIQAFEEIFLCHWYLLRIASWHLNNGYFDTEDHHHVKTTKLKNGLYHHIYKDKDDPDFVIHSLSRGDIKDPISIISGRHHPDDGTYVAHITATHPAYQGKGFGTGLKYRALKYHGNLSSDASISRPENKSWKKLSKLPGVITPEDIISI
jgi:GNAT superfamily N-acetyltransferase